MFSYRFSFRHSPSASSLAERLVVWMANVGKLSLLFMCYWNANEYLLLSLDTSSSRSPSSSRQAGSGRHEERRSHRVKIMAYQAILPFPNSSQLSYDISNTSFWSLGLRMENTNHCTPDLKPLSYSDIRMEYSWQNLKVIV